MVNDVVATQQRLDFFNSIFLIIYGLIAILILSIFFLIKSKIGWKKSFKVVGASLGITFVLETLFWIIGFKFGMFTVMCASFGGCPSQFDIFLSYLPYTLISVFIITLFLFSLVVFLRRGTLPS